MLERKTVNIYFIFYKYNCEKFLTSPLFTL